MPHSLATDFIFWTRSFPIQTVSCFIYKWQAISGTQIYRHMQGLAVCLSYIVNVLFVNTKPHVLPNTAFGFITACNMEKATATASYSNFALLFLPLWLASGFLWALSYDPIIKWPHCEFTAIPPKSLSESFLLASLRNSPNCGVQFPDTRLGTISLLTLTFSSMQLCGVNEWSLSTRWVQFRMVADNDGKIYHMVLIHLYGSLWQYVNMAYIPQTHLPAAGKSYCLLFAGFPGTDEFFHV